MEARRVGCWEEGHPGHEHCGQGLTIILDDGDDYGPADHELLVMAEAEAGHRDLTLEEYVMGSLARAILADAESRAKANRLRVG